jgi:hypothetical protein
MTLLDFPAWLWIQPPSSSDEKTTRKFNKNKTNKNTKTWQEDDNTNDSDKQNHNITKNTNKWQMTPQKSILKKRKTTNISNYFMDAPTTPQSNHPPSVGFSYDFQIVSNRY